MVKLRRIGNSTTVILPTAVLEAMHLHENDEVAIEVVGDRIVLTPATTNFQDVWEAYQEIELHYSNANCKLGE